MHFIERGEELATADEETQNTDDQVNEGIDQEMTEETHETNDRVIEETHYRNEQVNKRR